MEFFKDAFAAKLTIKGSYLPRLHDLCFLGPKALRTPSTTAVCVRSCCCQSLLAVLRGIHSELVPTAAASDGYSTRDENSMSMATWGFSGCKLRAHVSGARALGAHGSAARTLRWNSEEGRGGEPSGAEPSGARERVPSIHNPFSFLRRATAISVATAFQSR